MDLTLYDRHKLELAGLLRSEKFAPKPLAAARDALMTRLARDRFNLVTAGRFSRGKSTLMNALLHTTRLPMGIVPLTSVITVVKYGTVPRATLYYHGTNLFMDITLDELEKHITERGNPGNRENIARAEIDLPAPLLRYGFRFVDTPGLGSAIAENTATTLEFLSQANALLVVTSFDSALSSEEIDLLRLAKKTSTQVFLAVNKADMASAAERDTVLAHIQTRLAQEQLGPVHIFPVSALTALKQPEGSGIEALRQAIIEFCVVASQAAFLTEICADIQALLQKAGDEAGLTKLQTIQTRIATTAPDAPTLDLTETAPRRACPICEALGQESFNLISKLQFQLGRNIAVREAFAHGPKLCAIHTQQFGKLAGPLSVAQGLADSVDAIAARLDAQGRDPVVGACPVCEALKAAEAQQISMHAAQEPDSSAMICLRHIPALLACLPPTQRQATLMRLLTHYQRLGEDLRRFALRRDGATRSAITADETRAATDAIDVLAGNPDAWWVTPPF